MTKQQILAATLEKYEAYVADWHNDEKWRAYVSARKDWRTVRGGE